MPDDVVLVTGEGRAEDGSDADRVLVDVRRDVVRADRVLVRLQRHDPRLDVEVAAELLPHHVHVATEDQVRAGRGRTRGLTALAPVPLQREPAQHDRLGRPLGARSGGLAGAWNRSASIRMQRCSISAVRGYSAWSMKFRCRLPAMILRASGSIQVVTKVARLRPGRLRARGPHRPAASPPRATCRCRGRSWSAPHGSGTCCRTGLRWRLRGWESQSPFDTTAHVAARLHPDQVTPPRGCHAEPFSSSVLKPSSSRTGTPSCSAFSALEPGLSPTTT